MNALATIFFSLIAILASLVFIVSSLCAFSSSVGTAEDRHFFMQCAVAALIIALASTWKVVTLNRKPARRILRELDPLVPPYSIAPPGTAPSASEPAATHSSSTPSSKVPRVSQPGVAPPYVPRELIQPRRLPDVAAHLSPASQTAIQQLALAIAATIAARVALALVGWYGLGWYGLGSHVSLGARAPFPLFRFGFVAWGLAALAPSLILLYTLARRPGPSAFAFSLVIPALHALFGVFGPSALLVLILPSSQGASPLLSIIPWILDVLILCLAWRAIRLTGIHPDLKHLITALVVILLYSKLLPILFVLLH
jgi:hypothetical protein